MRPEESERDVVYLTYPAKQPPARITGFEFDPESFVKSVFLVDVEPDLPEVPLRLVKDERGHGLLDLDWNFSDIELVEPVVSIDQIVSEMNVSYTSHVWYGMEWYGLSNNDSNAI